jgi:hypothetical protein
LMSMTKTKTSSDAGVISKVLNLVDLAQFISRKCRVPEQKFRAIYEEATKGSPSRELTVAEAEELIRPFESASDSLKLEIEKSLRSPKP